MLNFLVNAILEFEEWLTASIIRVGEVWKLFRRLQNKLRKALLFITKDFNGPSVFFSDSIKQKAILHSITMIIPYPVWKCLTYRTAQSLYYLGKTPIPLTCESCARKKMWHQLSEFRYLVFICGYPQFPHLICVEILVSRECSYRPPFLLGIWSPKWFFP